MSLEVFADLFSGKPAPIDATNLLGGNNTVIMADPRKGKSYTAAKICEELCRSGLPFVILDPEGEYYSLREKFIVLVVGVSKAENCDISVGEEHADLLVRQFLDSRIPLIIDLSAPDVDEDIIHEFLAAFMSQLIRAEGTERIPCLVVIDEADEYIPERGHKPRGVDYAEFSKLVKKGGKRGIGTIIISHRPTWVAKDLLAKCQNWVLMSQTYKDDLERIEDLTRIPLKTLMGLKDRRVGEALLYGAITKDKVAVVKCLARTTTHIGTTPEIKPQFIERPELLGVLEGFRKELSQITSRREREVSEVERLNQQVKELGKVVQERDDRIKMLETAGEAAKMVEKRQPQGPNVDVVSFQEYQVLKRNFDELSRKFKDLEAKSILAPGINTNFSIDDYGNVTAAYPWLTRLIALNRTKAIIIKRLMEKGEATANQIALEYGFHVDTMRSHLNELLKRGVLTESSHIPHRYSLRRV